MIALCTCDCYTSHVQTQIQWLLQLGVRSSYPACVLESIRDLSLPELLLDQYDSDDIPVRARLPGCEEWVQVRDCLFYTASATYKCSTHSDHGEFVDDAQATLCTKSRKILLPLTTGSRVKKFSPSNAVFFFFDEIRCWIFCHTNFCDFIPFCANEFPLCIRDLNLCFSVRIQRTVDVPVGETTRFGRGGTLFVFCRIQNLGYRTQVIAWFCGAKTFLLLSRVCTCVGPTARAVAKAQTSASLYRRHFPTLRGMRPCGWSMELAPALFI